ncbi:MAG TPA: hypothetical protein VK992_07300, partial [Candidatus Caenarcaniphilales bacterium]|nr:hypothetical protein [Candidatus Caenarcaniphilales bacterium]
MNERTEQARTLHPTIHLVPHTHWDREWYEPFQVFRMRLVELVDHVLELLDAEPEFRFTLDGQLATIDDYLEVRPEAEPRIRRFVAEGRLAVGPWQILMDEFHVSGETIVRNLQRGWARARELGGAMEIGYLPDMFGHIAQMPQILRGAGMSDAVVWRGVPAAVERNHFAWRSPDGSEVRSEYLVGGYGNGVFLFAVPGRAADKARAHHALMRPFYGDETLLAMYGSDHMSPLRETVSLVDGVNASQSEVRVRIDTLADYIRASRDTERDEPLVIEGELRSSARANILMGVTSAHTDIKAAAARAERWLTRYAEPFQALYGGIWPARLFDLAWQRVIENSAHDSICGCSVDPVAAQVLVRYAEAEQIARGLTARALAPLASRVARGSWICANPSPHHRAGLVELAVAAPDSWPAVALELTDGRRIAAQEIRRNRPVVYEAEFTRADLLRFLQTHLGGRHTLGKIVNGGRVERQEQGSLLTLDLDDDPDPEWVDIDELRTELELAVASLGDGRWTLRGVAAPRRTVRAMVDAPALGFAALRPVNGPGSIDDRVVASSDTLRNGLLQVSVAGDGTLSLMRGGITIEGVGRLVDGGDAGDSYNYAPPRDDVTIDQPESVTTVLVAGGPVVGELVVTRTYNWPLALAEDASTRAAVTTTVAVAMHVELRA